MGIAQVKGVPDNNMGLYPYPEDRDNDGDRDFITPLELP